MSIDTKIVERLQALLNKTTENGCTEAEANSAMEAAQRIAIKHNLDLAQVLSSSAHDGKTKGLETDRTDLTDTACKKRRPHHNPISQVLVEVFDVRFIWVGGYNSSSGLKVCILGEKTDVALATYCWDWLCQLYPKLYKDFAEAEGLTAAERHNDVRRKSFFIGLSQGMCQSNQRQRQDVSNTADGAAYALVLVKKSEVVQARASLEFPGLRTFQIKNRAFDHRAHTKGHQKGLDIKLNGGLANGADAPCRID